MVARLPAPRSTVRFRSFILAACAVLAAAFAAAPAHAKYASIVVDFETGRVLHQQGADERRHPASLTKMMTLYMVFEALDAKQIDQIGRAHV